MGLNPVTVTAVGYIFHAVISTGHSAQSLYETLLKVQLRNATTFLIFILSIVLAF